MTRAAPPTPLRSLRSQADIKLFDPAVAGGKGAFPFRENSFYVLPTKAEEELNWKGEASIKSDMAAVWANYVERKGRGGGGDFAKDDAILAALA